MRYDVIQCDYQYNVSDSPLTNNPQSHLQLQPWQTCENNPILFQFCQDWFNVSGMIKMIATNVVISRDCHHAIYFSPLHLWWITTRGCFAITLGRELMTRFTYSPESLGHCRPLRSPQSTGPVNCDIERHYSANLQGILAQILVWSWWIWCNWWSVW